MSGGFLASGAVAFWLAAWALNHWLAKLYGGRAWVRYFVPALFGITLLILWEGLVRGLNVSPVILPAPSMIGARIVEALPILWTDFTQTILKGALSGYLIGCGAAVLTAIAIDRSPFLQAGLLPVGNFVAALPIVGIAPILVMWFGFDWHSKAAVVVVMVFFPVLVNTVAGLAASERMQRDLMATANRHVVIIEAVEARDAKALHQALSHHISTIVDLGPAFGEMTLCAMGGKPRELFDGCGPESLVLGQLFDQLGV